MADTNTIQLADIIAPNTPPPAPPPYGWIALGVVMTLIFTLFILRQRWRHGRDRRTALRLIKQAEHALQQQTMTPRAAAFQAAQALRGVSQRLNRDCTPDWAAFIYTLDQALYAPQSPSVQDAAQLLAQARGWIKPC